MNEGYGRHYQEHGYACLWAVGFAVAMWLWLAVYNALWPERKRVAVGPAPRRHRSRVES